MKALVTGATGFIGSHLVDALSRLGWSVTCFTRHPVHGRDASMLCVAADLARPADFGRVLRRLGPVDAIFHLGARIPSPGRPDDPVTMLRTNVVGTATLLTFAARSKTPVFVYASSLAVIGRPTSVPITEDHPVRPVTAYHLSKLAGELLSERLRRQGRRIVSLRLTSPYGPGMPDTTVLPRFVRAALDGRDLTLLGSGRRQQNFVHVDDVVQACLAATTSDAAGVFNVAGPRAVSMSELAHRILACVPGTAATIAYAAAPDPQEDYRWDVDLTASQRALGYRPGVALEQGLGNYVELVRTGRAPARWWKAA